MNTLAPKYITRFQCLGDRCEDTCCGTWNVPVDKDSYDRLAALMGPKNAAEFDTIYERRDNPGPQNEHYARIPNCGGSCSQLVNGLCGLHTRFGIEALADVCATYPRQLRQNHGRVEQAGKPSCPEVARQLLFPADAFELVSFDVDTLIRKKAEHIDIEDPIRDAMMTLLAVEGAPLPTRLYYAARFASRVDAGEHPTAVWNAMANETTLTKLHRQFSGLEVSLEPAMSAVSRLIVARTQAGLAFAGFAEALNRALSVPKSETVAVYLARRNAAQARWGPTIDRAFTHLAQNWWFTTPTTTPGELGAHHKTMLVRFAAMRWILFSQPEMSTLAQIDELQAAIVRVVYNFSRTFDHGERFLRTQVNAMPDGMAHLSSLAKF